jgi:two-component system, LytTR family, response regulator
MNALRTLIVDDEKLARDRLRRLLTAEPDIELVGECANGPEAVRVIREQRPDLVFLDVQMPGLDGFGVIGALEKEKPPVIVFVTAFDRYAVRAFEVHAVDYLLKPFDRARFQQAMTRARGQLQARQSGELARRLAALAAGIQHLKAGRGAEDRLAIKAQGRTLLLKPADIDWIEAADNYVHIHAGNVSCLHRETLTSMERRLPAARFLRISRSVIVNVDRVKEVAPLFHGDHTVTLRDGTRLTLTRNHREQLARLLGK